MTAAGTKMKYSIDETEIKRRRKARQERKREKHLYNKFQEEDSREAGEKFYNSTQQNTTRILPKKTPRASAQEESSKENVLINGSQYSLCVHKLQK
jgi:hypothetical protein